MNDDFINQTVKCEFCAQTVYKLYIYKHVYVIDLMNENNELLL